MLAYVLALVVGLGSFALYMAAFFFPEVHRKNDFIWSGVGLFYALVLWVCAGRITGGVLLGQTASVALLGWLSWQTLTLRRQVVPINQQTALPNSGELKSRLSDLSKPENLSKLSGQVGEQFGKLRSRAQGVLPTPSKLKNQPAQKAQPYVPLTPDDFASARRDRLAAENSAVVETSQTVPTEVIQPEASVLPEAQSTAVGQPKVRSQAAKAAPKPNVKSGSSTGFFAAITQPLQSLLKGGAKQESKPVYVRKQYRTPAEAGATEAGATEGEATEVKASEPNAIAPRSTEVAPVNLDQSLQADAIVTDAVLEENEAEITSPPDPPDGWVDDTAMPADAIVEAEIEYESHRSVADDAPNNPAPDAAPDMANLEQSVSDLEETAAEPAEPSLEAIPPHPPSPELVQAAIEDAEEKHLPASPPEPESVTDTVESAEADEAQSDSSDSENRD